MSPQTLLEKLGALKEKGNEHFKQANYASAV